jgi:predicted acylesterase/phospholipase RssA
MALGLSASVTACAAPERLAAVPRDRTAQATVLGLPNERFLATSGIAPLEAEVIATLTRGDAAGGPMRPLNLLAVSGGGEDGAFGAGLLCGWTEAGNRPVFDLVTGVSTGALTAPFAYLGSAYDQPLREVYTQITAAQVLRARWLPTAIFADGLADNSPLFETITRYITPRMIADMAAAYQQGRILLLGSTNLDAQLPVIWNIGAIAASGHPRSAELIRKIMLASAAIPGAFSPVLFDVTLDGAAFQELHVDGGAIAQVFLYPPALTRSRRARIAARQPVRDIHAYVIRNARLDAQWANVDRRTMGIAGRAISTMIFSAGYNDVVRIWNTARQDQVDYNLGFIGPEFTQELTTPFETAYMQALFENGYQRARAGFVWAKEPPFINGADPTASPVATPAPPRPRRAAPAA